MEGPSVKRLASAALVGSAVAAVIAAAAGPAGAVNLLGDRDTIPPAAPTAATTAPAQSERNVRPDNRPGPLTKTWVAQRNHAVDLVSKGKATASSDGVVELADGKAVEVATLKTDKIFTILSEFGTQGAGKYGTVPGPLHNEIPGPDRSKDNSTTWTQDHDKGY